MKLPELIRRSAEKELARYCENKVPPCFRNEVRVGFSMEDAQATLYEERLNLANPGQWVARPVAQFRFQPEFNQWTLHYPDACHAWRLYLNANPTLNLKQLIQAVDDDPFNSFWD